MDIKLIPSADLLKDLQASKEDLAFCKLAFRLDIIACTDKSMRERVRTNVKIIMVIEAELARRNKSNESEE